MDWFQAQRKAHTVTVVAVGLTLDSACELNATITQSSGNTDKKGVKRQTQYFHFIFDTSDIKNVNTEKKIPLSRDLKIWVGDDVYQVTFEGGLKHEYNDPLQRDLILTAYLKVDSTNET